jgi:hypothetical protein
MESMTRRSPRRAGVARVDERLTGVAERPDALGVAFLAVAFFAGMTRLLKLTAPLTLRLSLAKRRATRGPHIRGDLPTDADVDSSCLPWHGDG